VLQVGQHVIDQEKQALAPDPGPKPSVPQLRKHYQVGQENQLDTLGIMINIIVLWQTVYTQAALDHLAANGHHPDPADVARLSPLGHPTINLNGRYQTTTRPPTSGLRPLRIPPDDEPFRILFRSSSQAVSHNFVAALWREYDLQPHRQGTFKLSTDPDFEEKVVDVVGLYLDPPMGIVNLLSFGLSMDTWNLGWAPGSISAAELRQLPWPCR
jgi:hypothetical protein